MGRLQLNLHQVISFYFVAKEKSFSRAAETLAITQSAVTQHIQAIEIQFGVKLINVKKKRVFLTKAGDKLLPYAEGVYNEAVLTENFLKTYRFNNISIGIATALVFFFTSLIDHFKELYPSVRVYIRDGSSLPLIEELLDSKLDICLVGVVPPYSEKLRLYRIPVDQQMFFVASPEYPLPANAVLTWNELTTHPLIIQAEGSASRSLLRGLFAKKGLEPLIAAEVNNVELAKELARQKKGLALMFEANIQEEIATGRLRIIPIKDNEIKMGAIDVLVNKAERISPAVESFLGVLKRHFNDNIKEVPSQ